MKKKNFIKDLGVKISLCVLLSILGFLHAFDKLDYHLYDSCFKIRKEPAKNEKILMVEVDDNSIRNLGEWPWTRDIIADALLNMKELNAACAIFDIEYISPSQYGISPSATQKIETQINETRELLNSTMDLVSENLDSPYYTTEDLRNIINEAKESQIDSEINGLNDYIQNSMYRDNDDYFARCIQFFGNAFLTVNNQDLNYEVTEMEKDYIKKRFLYHNLLDQKNRIIADNNYTSKTSYDGSAKGFQPALHILVNHSNGVGFTNSVIDSDGTRRRFEVFYEYDGCYLGQLTVSPLLKILDVKNVKRNKHSYVFENALFPGETERRNIKIPVDNHGTILINWRKGALNNSFNNESIISLLQLNDLEKNIVTCLNLISSDIVYDAENGMVLPYVNDAVDLINFYSEISDYKEYLLSLCTGFDSDGNAFDGISDEMYEEYFGARKNFFAAVAEFLARNDLDSILENLYLNVYGSSDEEIAEVESYLVQDFDVLRQNLEQYNYYISEMKPKYDGAYCIIGNTAASTTDLGATPLQKKYENVGLHANVMNTILTESFITYIDWLWPFFICFALSLILLAFTCKEQHIQNIIGGAGVIVISAIWAVLFIVFDIYMPFVPAFIYIFADYILCVIIRFIASNKEKKFMTQLASSFANKDTVKILKDHPELFTTKGEKKNITALFSDVQKFSTLSESLGMVYGDDAPSKLVEILNEYLGDMSNEILFNNGTIDKYEGDAIISMFGAPDPENRHTKEEWAFLCLDSAIRMKKREAIFNKTHKDLFIPVDVWDKNQQRITVELKPLQTRIGINSGEAYVGMMGSKTENFSKLNYTMMGDTVNLASRLEGVNKVYKSWIMCSDDTWNLANTGANKDKIIAKRLDRVRVVGRSTPVQLYNILGFADEADEKLLKELEVFDKAMDEYIAGNFQKAGKMFMEASEIYSDDTALIYAARCKDFIQKGVPEKWDGVVSMTSK